MLPYALRFNQNSAFLFTQKLHHKLLGSIQLL